MPEGIKDGDRVRILKFSFKDREGKVQFVGPTGISVLLDGETQGMYFFEGEYKRVEKPSEVI